MKSLTTIPAEQQADQLEQSLIALNLVFRKHRDFIKEKYKISALEMELIQYVMREGPQKMKAVSEYFHIKLSTLTSIIDKAEKHRILKRVHSREDRRVVFLDVTKKGKSVFEEYNQFLRKLAEEVKLSFEEEGFDDFVKSMEIFTQLTVRN
ncbi:transcriptional regulator, SarA/Rot family [Pontibacter sp. G13]|uniref:MarR family winged helix-turn-helix transcriptional regulator n=1 Tax=Pontibacter sp. G13 TaxID=3074898 RepID=UPI00288AD569|nr:MarR family transcriptional regulator [Pontibacter sp. G13]WNJ20754.1 MarR family transcriptional regulator [Pontibacter sp. G13]